MACAYANVNPLKFSGLNLIRGFAWAGAILLFVKLGTNSLSAFGLQMDTVVAEGASRFVGATIGEIEGQGKGAFFVVQLKHRSGKTVNRPQADLRVEAGDGIVIVGRQGLVAATTGE